MLKFLLYTAMGKIIRTSKKSPILAAAWLEKHANIFMIKICKTKNFQTIFKSKISKIIKMHEFLRF